MAIIRQAAYPLVGRLQRAIAAEGVVSNFRAADYTANSGSWVVTENQRVVRITRVGQLALVNFAVENTSVTGTPTMLRLSLPLGYIAASDADASMAYLDDGTPGIGIVSIAAQESLLSFALDLALTPWATAVGTTTIRGQILVEVRPVSG